MSDPKSLPPAENPGESAPKKPTATAKAEASRRNARRAATGPKTPRGKKNSSRNAIKHGLLAKEVLITSGPAKEDENEFASLQTRMWECHQPVGFEEEQLVAGLIDCEWKTRRARRFENASKLI